MDKENLPIIYFSYYGTAPPSYYGIRYQYVPGAWPLEWPPHADKVPADAARKILAISVIIYKIFGCRMIHFFIGSGCDNPVDKDWLLDFCI